MSGRVPARVNAGMAVSTATAGERLGSRTSCRSLLLHETVLQPWTCFLKADAGFLHSTKLPADDRAWEHEARARPPTQETKHNDRRSRLEIAPPLQRARSLRTLRKPQPEPVGPAIHPAFQLNAARTSASLRMRAPPEKYQLPPAQKVRRWWARRDPNREKLAQPQSSSRKASLHSSRAQATGSTWFDTWCPNQ